MTSPNGAAPPQAEEAAVSPEESPASEVGQRLEVMSLDYWREMTQRQVERLQRRIAVLEDEAKPLREQAKVLTAALSAIAVANGVRAGGVDLQITDDERVLVAQLVAQGQDTAAIGKRLPHVKKSMLYSVIYSARDKLAKNR